LCKLSRWRVLGGPWCFKLRELRGGLLPGRQWGIELHGLYRRKVCNVAGCVASLELHGLRRGHSIGIPVSIDIVELRGLRGRHVF